MHFRSSLLSLRNLNIYHHLYWAKFQVFVANMVAGYCPIFEHLYQRSLPTEELLDSQMKVFSCWNKADLQAGKYTARSLFFFRFSEGSTLVHELQAAKLRDARNKGGSPGGHLGIFWVGMCPPPGLQIGTPF